MPAGRDGQHRDARIGHRQGQGGRPERAEGHGRAVAAVARGDGDHREEQAGERAQDEEEAQVRRRDEGRAADVEADGRVQRQGRDERGRQADQAHRGRDPRPRASEQGGARSR